MIEFYNLIFFIERTVHLERFTTKVTILGIISSIMVKVVTELYLLDANNQFRNEDLWGNMLVKVWRFHCNESSSLLVFV